MRRFLSRRRAGNTDIGREAAIVRGHVLIAVGGREGLGGDAEGVASPLNFSLVLEAAVRGGGRESRLEEGEGSGVFGGMVNCHLVDGLRGSLCSLGEGD